MPPMVLTSPPQILPGAGRDKSVSDRGLRTPQLCGWGAATLLVALSGCGGISLGDDPESCDLRAPQDEKHNVSVVTFWTQLPELEALRVLIRRVADLGGNMSQTPRDNRTDLQTGLLIPGDPVPDVYQVNGGSDVLQLAFDAPGDATKICPLDRIFDDYDLRDHYFETAWRPSVCRGSHYAVPLSIHRVNTLLVNKPLYTRAQDLAAMEQKDLADIQDMKTVAELIETLEWIASSGLETESGRPAVPLSIGIGSEQKTLTDTWPLTILAYENLLASYPDQAYERVWQGLGDFDSVEAALHTLTDDLGRLGAVSNLQEALTWQQATEEVIAGRAVMTVNGDWILALASAADMDELEMLTFPNAVPTFVYTPDSFAVPRARGKDGSAAHGWFRDVINHRSTQTSFFKKKRAIPARNDIDPSTLHEPGFEYLQETYEEFHSCQPDATPQADKPCRLLLAVSGLAPGGGYDPCFDRTERVLAVLAGVEYDESDWREKDEANSAKGGCEQPYPLDRKEAKQELLRILQQVSEHPFAEDCR